MGLLQDWFGPPKEIDPNKVYGMMQSEYTQDMKDRSDALVDPNSPLMQAQNRQIQENTSNNIYSSSRLQRQNNARLGGGQSGILNANVNAAATTYSGEGANAFTNMMLKIVCYQVQLLTI